MDEEQIQQDKERQIQQDKERILFNRSKNLSNNDAGKLILAIAGKEYGQEAIKAAAARIIKYSIRYKTSLPEAADAYTTRRDTISHWLNQAGLQVALNV